MTTSAPSGITWLLRAVAALQGVAIAALAVLLAGADDVAPADVSPGTAPALPAAAAPAQTTLPVADREGAAAAAHTLTVPVATVANDAGAGTVLYGRVGNEAGEAITDGVVWFSRPGDSKQLASVSLNQRDACFAIAGLMPGEVEFRTRATGYQEKSGTIQIPAGTPRLRHDIVLVPAWMLAVKILTPEGKPLHVALREMAKERPALRFVEAAAVVTATRPEGDFPPTGLREITHGLGRWRGSTGFGMRGETKQPPDVAGVVEIDGKQPLWVSAVLRHRVLASVAVEPGQAEVTLTVSVDQVLHDLGTIRGRIVDDGGAPVGDAHVSFGDQQSGGMHSKVDANALFEVQNLRPGLLTMEVSSGNRYASNGMVLLEPGQVLDLGDVPLCDLRAIKGRCEGIVGKAEACWISCTSLDPPPHPAMRRDNRGGGSVAADGSFTLHLADGRYRVRASGAGGAVSEIDTRTLGDQPLVLQLAKESSLRLDVQSNGEPFELAMFDSAGREVYRRDLRHGWKFALPFLPGDYRVELKDGRGKVETRRIQLGDAGADLRVP